MQELLTGHGTTRRFVIRACSGGGGGANMREILGKLGGNAHSVSGFLAAAPSWNVYIHICRTQIKNSVSWIPDDEELPAGNQNSPRRDKNNAYDIPILSCFGPSLAAFRTMISLTFVPSSIFIRSCSPFNTTDGAKEVVNSLCRDDDSVAVSVNVWVDGPIKMMCRDVGTANRFWWPYEQLYGHW